MVPLAACRESLIVLTMAILLIGIKKVQLHFSVAHMKFARISFFKKELENVMPKKYQRGAKLHGAKLNACYLQDYIHGLDILAKAWISSNPS